MKKKLTSSLLALSLAFSSAPALVNNSMGVAQVQAWSLSELVVDIAGVLDGVTEEVTTDALTAATDAYESVVGALDEVDDTDVTNALAVAQAALVVANAGGDNMLTSIETALSSLETAIEAAGDEVDSDLIADAQSTITTAIEVTNAINGIDVESMLEGLEGLDSKDIADALTDALTDALGDILDEDTTVQDVVDNVDNVLDSVTDALEELLGVEDTTLSDLATDIYDEVKDLIDDIITEATDNGIDSVDDIVGVLTDLVETVLDEVLTEEVLEELGLSADDIEGIITEIETELKEVIEQILTEIETSEMTEDEIKEALTEALTEALGYILDNLESLEEVLDSLKESDEYEDILNSTLLDVLEPAISDIVSTLVDTVLDDLIEALKDAVDDDDDNENDDIFDDENDVDDDSTTSGTGTETETETATATATIGGTATFTVVDFEIPTVASGYSIIESLATFQVSETGSIIITLNNLNTSYKIALFRKPTDGDSWTEITSYTLTAGATATMSNKGMIAPAVTHTGSGTLDLTGTGGYTYMLAYVTGTSSVSAYNASNYYESGSIRVNGTYVDQLKNVLVGELKNLNTITSINGNEVLGWYKDEALTQTILDPSQYVVTSDAIANGIYAKVTSTVVETLVDGSYNAGAGTPSPEVSYTPTVVPSTIASILNKVF